MKSVSIDRASAFIGVLAIVLLIVRALWPASSSGSQVAAVHPVVVFEESDSEEVQKVRANLLGAWELVSYTYLFHGPVVITQHPHGKDAVGQIMYTPDGHMSVNIMERGCTHFKGTRPHRGTKDEMANAMGHYQAYAGRFTVGYGKNKTIMLKHVLDMSLYPNWAGGDQFRIAKMEGDQLTLTPPDDLHYWNGIKIEAILKWKKAKGAPAAARTHEKSADGVLEFYDEGFESEGSTSVPAVKENGSKMVQFVESDAGI